MTSTPPSNPGEDRALIYNGRYELTRQIARGGTAQVYLARDLLLDRPVALKVLFPELSSDPSFVDRFRREAQAAANLSHPNIVPVFDWGESERTYFIVMEYVDGEPLSAIIRSQAPLPAARAVGVAADIAKALSYAHRHGVVHRDVKPGNVLLTRDGQVKVTDFGIARAVGADHNVTQTGLVMGTATYFSPEQAQGLGVDGRSDVYALGVVLYEMVTGRPPFSADTPVAIAYKHVSEPAVPPREVEPRVPVALDAVIMRAMAKQPADRYPTADDFYADLQRYTQGVPVLAAGGAAGLGLTQAIGTTGYQDLGATQALAGGTTTMLPGGAAPELAPPGARDEAASGTPKLPKRRWAGWTLAGLILAAALAFIVYTGGRSLGYFGAAGYFHMPDEQSRSYLAAVDQLHVHDGLKVAESGIHNAAAKGTVLHQRPSPGTLVRRGESVRLVYSIGPRSVGVPAVVGEPESAAESALKAAGLTPKVAFVLPTSIDQVPGIVTKTIPIAHTLVPLHGTVTLDVVQGTYHVTVPSVVNDTVHEAEAALIAKNLEPGQEISEPSGTVRAGLVAGTNPAAGSSEPINTQIELIISSGPPATVPRVIGLTESAAEAALRKAGLNFTVQEVSGLPSDDGYVENQSVTAGTEEPQGFNVIIYVVQTTTTTTAKAPPTTTKKHHGAPPGHSRRRRAHRRSH